MIIWVWQWFWYWDIIFEIESVVLVIFWGDLVLKNGGALPVNNDTGDSNPKYAQIYNSYIKIK